MRRHIKVRAAESGEESNPGPSLNDEILARQMEMGTTSGSTKRHQYIDPKLYGELQKKLVERGPVATPGQGERPANPGCAGCGLNNHTLEHGSFKDL